MGRPPKNKNQETLDDNKEQEQKQDEYTENYQQIKDMINDDKTEVLLEDNVEIQEELTTEKVVDNISLVMDSEEIQELNETIQNKVDPSRVVVEVNFIDNKPNKVEYTMLSTGGTHDLITDSQKISLLQSRIYKIPINVTGYSTEDPDIQMKVFNEIMLNFDIRCITSDGFAYIQSLRNNGILYNRAKLAILIKS